MNESSGTILKVGMAKSSVDLYLFIILILIASCFSASLYILGWGALFELFIYSASLANFAKKKLLMGAGHHKIFMSIAWSHHDRINIFQPTVVKDSIKKPFNKAQ